MLREQRSNQSRHETRMRFRSVLMAISFRMNIYAEIFQQSNTRSEVVLSRSGRARRRKFGRDCQTRRLLIGGDDDAAIFRVRRIREGEGEVSIWPSYDNTTADNFRIPIHGQSNGKNGNPSVISVMDSFDSTSICVRAILVRVSRSVHTIESVLCVHGR